MERRASPSAGTPLTPPGNEAEEFHGTHNRKRSTLANRAIVASAALILGGGGLVAANIYASAHEGRSSGPQNAADQEAAGSRSSTIDCPEVGQ